MNTFHKTLASKMYAICLYIHQRPSSSYLGAQNVINNSAFRKEN